MMPSYLEKPVADEALLHMRRVPLFAKIAGPPDGSPVMECSMTLKRKLVTLADRPGVRSLLSAVATRWARSLSGDRNVAITYDDMWIDVVDGVFLPRAPKFDYYAAYLARMKHFARERLDGSVDYWTHIYKPKPGDVIIDVGAGIGVDAIALSKLIGPSGCIHSIEPHPWTYAALSKACKLNKLDNVYADLSPNIHPAMGRILWSFEPVWLGDATGRGAEPST